MSPPPPSVRGGRDVSYRPKSGAAVAFGGGASPLSVTRTVWSVGAAAGAASHRSVVESTKTTRAARDDPNQHARPAVGAKLRPVTLTSTRSAAGAYGGSSAVATGGARRSYSVKSAAPADDATLHVRPPSELADSGAVRGSPLASTRHRSVAESTKVARRHDDGASPWRQSSASPVGAKLTPCMVTRWGVPRSGAACVDSPVTSGAAPAS